MIISFKHKFIFVKTQKTAGTSIELCLSKYMGPDDIITPVSPPDELLRKKIGGIGPQNHNNNSYLPCMNYLWRKINTVDSVFNSHMSLEHLDRLKININDFEIVTISRNPWEVNASLYFYEKNKRPEKVVGDFNEWVIGNCIENFSKLNLHGKYKVDEVLSYENINESYSNWVQKKGLPDEAKRMLKKVNAKSGIRPKGLDYFSIYNDESREIVRLNNLYEIGKFNYKFNNDNQSIE